MTAISRALGRATEQLSKTSDTPRLDAEVLMAAALSISRDRLLLSNPNGQAPEIFYEFVERRLKDEPIAYITGHRDFWTIDLAVGPGVRPGFDLTRIDTLQIDTYDTFATACHALGLAIPDHVEGKPITEISYIVILNRYYFFSC